MTRHFLQALLVLGLCSLAPAQRMGGSNHDAPILTQSFSAQDGIDFRIDYHAITWADGKTMARMMEAERGARIRKRINAEAPNAPLGTMRADTPISLGGKNVVEGLYALYFTIDEELNWTLHAQNEVEDDIHYQWKLALVETEKTSARLSMSVLPAEAAGDANVTIAFGKWTCTGPAGPAKPEKKAPAEGKK